MKTIALGSIALASFIACSGGSDADTNENDGSGNRSGAGSAGRNGTSGSGGSSPGNPSGGSSAQAGAGAGGSGTAGSDGGSAGAAGSSGSAGTPGGAGASGDCPTALEGWASVSGDSVTTTTGGGNATPVRPTSAAELAEYASDAEPRVIEITRSFDIPSLQVNSNKTLVGASPDAIINGGVRVHGREDDYVRNVIVRNLRINGADTAVDGDAMHIYYAHHVWVDHVEIWDGPDANLDVVHGSNWVTISWSKFRYTAAAPDPAHKFSNLIGHSDNNASEDDGRLKVTLHHNWWSEGVTERMPRVRFGQVHSFNNYFNAPGNNYCVRAGRGAHILVENNYFKDVGSPHQFNNTSDEATAHITARNNHYDNAPGEDGNFGGGSPFNDPPYDVTLHAAADVPAIVQRCAGPR